MIDLLNPVFSYNFNFLLYNTFVVFPLFAGLSLLSGALIDVVGLSRVVVAAAGSVEVQT